MDYKFSVIIPAYNCEKTICKTLKSLENQKYKNFEVIVINDGSTDDTKKVLDTINITNLNIKILDKDNSGQIETRYKGIDFASSDYCLFLDADDEFIPETIQEINDSLNRYESDILCFNAYVVDEERDKRLLFSQYKDEETFFESLDEIKMDVIKSMRFNNIWLKCIRTSLLHESKKYSNVSYIRGGEDLLMQLPFFDMARTFTYLPKQLYLYNVNYQSITYSFDPNYYKAQVFINKELRKYSKIWNIPNNEQLCNYRFLSDTSIALQNIKKAKNYKLLKKIEYLKQIDCDPYYRKIVKENKDVGIKTKILLNVGYYKLYYLQLVLILLKHS